MQTPPVKRFLSVALGVAMAAMLAGCNAPQAAGTQPPAGSAPAVTDQATAPVLPEAVSCWL